MCLRESDFILAGMCSLCVCVCVYVCVCVCVCVFEDVLYRYTDYHEEETPFHLLRPLLRFLKSVSARVRPETDPESVRGRKRSKKV